MTGLIFSHGGAVLAVGCCSVGRGVVRRRVGLMMVGVLELTQHMLLLGVEAGEGLGHQAQRMMVCWSGMNSACRRWGG